MIVELNGLYERGLVSRNKHFYYDIYIWNYTPRVQYDRLWTPLLEKCRGLITDKGGNIITRGFSKFFNYEEIENKGIIPYDDEYIYIQEKMDGSLGIIFYYGGEWIICTRGSFESDQAKRGKELLDSMYDKGKFRKEYTYLCEIIYNENRIVVSYEEDMLMFLSIMDKDIELDWEESTGIFRESGIDDRYIVGCVKSKFTSDTFGDIKGKNTENKEGKVIRFYPSNFRLKIKYGDYIRLHRILTNISSRDIWEYMRDGRDIGELLDNVPDEFYEWVRGVKDKILFKYNSIEREYQWIFKILGRIDNFDNKKVFAEYAKKYKYSSILFSMYNKKDYSRNIWKLVYPEYELPFKKNNNE
jgi:RNA ligase